LRTLLSGSGTFDWGWSHLGCCLSRTGLESLELLSVSNCLGRKTDQVALPLDGSDSLEGSERVDKARRAGDSGPWGVSAVGQGSEICLFS
jgi:hypothetical protein